MSTVDRFAYRPYRDLPSPADDSALIFKPELKVLVRGTASHARELDLWGLVHIGATECILPYEVAGEVKATFKGKGSMADCYPGKKVGQAFCQRSVGFATLERTRGFAARDSL